MWALSFAIFFGFKWWLYRASGASAPIGRVAGFLLLWPGMDAAAFFKKGEAGGTDEWGGAVAKTALGAVLFMVAARRFEAPWAVGWCGLIGLALFLHCGVFHLLSLAWRAAGADARPLMNEPLLAGSLGDFWGNRWNHAFRDISYELIFAPLHKDIGATAATALIFLVSGLIHELAISFPAGGGYGLPLMYFAIQGAGVIMEKSRAGRRLGLGRGQVGRAFAVVFAAGPVYWLFHPRFIAQVIIPFMKAAGAL
jgi:hypothetical protein